VVAVNDLCGHAYESWITHDTGKMWLKDFLPDDVKGIRIMSYGYNASLYNEMIDIKFLDFRRHSLQVLGNARRLTPVCVLLDPPGIYFSMITRWTNTFPSKPKDATIDIYWTWDGRALDTSGKAIQCSFSVIVSGIQNTWWRKQ
jgi:hypothetical protein